MKRLFLITISLYLGFSFITNDFSYAKGTKEQAEEQQEAESQLRKLSSPRADAIFTQFIEAIGKNRADYTFEVLESDVPNAFATVNRKMVIHTGLLNAVQGDVGLAFVIAHELGHIERRHVMKSVIRNSISSLIRHYIFRQNRYVNGFDYFHNLHYSRGKEREADFFAADLMNEFYCKDPGKLEFFLNVSAERKSAKIEEYFSTHPLPESRINYLREFFEESNCVL